MFVHGSNGQMEKIAQQTGLTGVQVHADPSLNGRPPSPDFLLNSNATRRYPQNCFLAKRVRACNGSFLAEDVLTPSFSIPAPGACRAAPAKILTGRKERRQVGPIGRMIPIVVAGGLTPDNVNDAMRVLEPWGSTYRPEEESPGKKNPQKIRAFIQAVQYRRQSNYGDSTNPTKKDAVVPGRFGAWGGRYVPER